MLFAVGQFLFFAGDLYTYSYPKLLGADVPFPSPGDAIYLLVYPALMGGFCCSCNAGTRGATGPG